MTLITGGKVAIWHRKDIDLEALTRLGDASMPGHLGIEFVELGEDWLRARMPVDRRTHQPFGRLHGGASVALAETVASVAGMLTVDPAEKVVVGLEINANHVRAARDGYVFAVAKAEAVGRTTQVWTIRITDERDKLVCLSRITLAVIAAGQA
ncbi:hotdog fold thioesterase [Sphingomonas sp. BN140010]|uniref:Hotdog fold thioesterase n=1 Tax=Sphingomonas arvum TaxID=2992113 RepID=A0ABT3JB15_9SPHN|nr:hotdog fold thioesterase [Sphingomonas sp. BN140010]MCW3796216.1 hotdog fold thioesterase [Sphingomonas sp. BN140010]